MDRVVALVALVPVVAGCTVPSVPDQPPPITPQQAQPSQQAQQSEQVPGTVHGTAVRLSDVGGMPDEPLDSGTVLAVPAREVSAFWETAGFGSTGPPEPRQVEFSVSPQTLPTGAEAATIAAGGTFTTGLAPGETLLCLADHLPGDDPGPPHRVTGCATVTAGPDGTVTVSTQRGGVFASPGSKP